MAYDKVVDSAQLDAGLTEIADAIRAKGGTSDPLAFPDGFRAAVQELTDGEAGGIKVIKQNLVDTSKNIANQYYERGVLAAYNNWSATQLIPIQAGVLYAINTHTDNAIKSQYSPLFSSAKEFVSNIGRTGGFFAPTDSSYLLFASPITGYIAFSSMTAIIDEMAMYRCIGNITEVS